MEIPTLQPGCPWYELSTWALPNVKWCEASQCSWITEPANTWSNSGYIGLGITLWALSARRKDALKRWFGITQLLVGLTSFIYHASYTFVFQVFDFAGMYGFTFLLLAFNLRRLGLVSPSSQWKVYFGAVVGLTVLTPLLRYVGAPIQGTILVLILALLGTELWARARRAPATDGRWITSGFALMGVASVFSALDVSRVLCDPDNHFFQGHAAWHLLGATALYCAYRGYAPLAPLLVAGPAAPHPAEGLRGAA
jgi:hypothetical protein